jgi:TolA-binding protein
MSATVKELQTYARDLESQITMKSKDLEAVTLKLRDVKEEETEQWDDLESKRQELEADVEELQHEKDKALNPKALKEAQDREDKSNAQAKELARNIVRGLTPRPDSVVRGYVLLEMIQPLLKELEVVLDIHSKKMLYQALHRVTDGLYPSPYDIPPTTPPSSPRAVPVAPGAPRKKRKNKH